MAQPPGSSACSRIGPTNYAQPSFETTRLDERTGAIHVIPTDLNKDGRLDFVALISQQHETVVAYLNNGAGGFAQETLYMAPHPNWGSSGMQLVDFDGDGDLDVLVTNGDSFDDFLLKPYQGIQWLENEGRYPYTAHPLASLAGAHRALAVDLDGDGDLDVVASAMIALAREGVERTLPSIVWLERTGPKRFTRHTLEMGMPIARQPRCRRLRRRRRHRSRRQQLLAAAAGADVGGSVGEPHARR